MDVKTRLMTFIAHKGMNISEFERSCGLANAYVRHIRQTIMPDKLEAILSVYPELNVEWLMTGRGMMEYSETPTMLPYDATILYDEYARLLECALWVAIPTRDELLALQMSVHNTIDSLRRVHQSFGHLELLYKRIIRLQSWCEKR